MKSLTTISTTNMRWLSLAALVAILAMAAIGAGLARELYFNLPSRLSAPARSVGVPAQLDLHERHPELFAPRTSAPAPLDLHERHMPAAPITRAPLDLHERHSTTSVGTPTALDLHERHPQVGGR
jgi:hypothetical protein